MVVIVEEKMLTLNGIRYELKRRTQVNRLRRVEKNSDDIKTRIFIRSGRRLLATCLLRGWYPAFRRRDFKFGFSMELREPVLFMLKENPKGKLVTRESVLMEYTGADQPVVVKKFL